MSEYGPDLWFASFSGLLGSISYGYQLGVMNTPLRVIARDLDFSFELHGAAVVSALLAGGVLGALAAGMAADAIGPKRAMMYNNLILSVGCATAFFSPAFAGLFTARVLTGVASGGVSLFVPRYVAEVAPPRIRGALGSLSQLFICTGILLSYLAGLPYSNSATAAWGGVAWWRLMLLIPFAPALLQAALLTCCPESPVWLRWRGKHDEARRVERRLSTAEPQADELGAGADAEGQQALLHGDGNGHVQQFQQEGEDTSWVQLLRPGGRYTRMVVLAIGVSLTQQLSGINTVVYYSSDVFGEAGLKSPILGAVLVGVVNIFGTIGATGVTDRLGRKPLLVASHAGMAASLLAITLTGWLPGNPPSTGAAVAFACILVFVVFFSIGSGPLPFLYISEILSSSIKGKVSSVAVSLNWLANFVVGLSFPAMVAHLGGIGNAFFVYALLNVANAVFCAALMVETKGQPILQIQRGLLEGGLGASAACGNGAFARN